MMETMKKNARIVDTDEELDVHYMVMLRNYGTKSYVLGISLNRPCSTVVPDIFMVESEYLTGPVQMYRDGPRRLVSYDNVQLEVLR